LHSAGPNKQVTIERIEKDSSGLKGKQEKANAQCQQDEQRIDECKPSFKRH
jgi:hypothetical protein